MNDWLRWKFMQAVQQRWPQINGKTTVTEVERCPTRVVRFTPSHVAYFAPDEEPDLSSQHVYEEQLEIVTLAIPLDDRPIPPDIFCERAYYRVAYDPVRDILYVQSSDPEYRIGTLEGTDHSPRMPEVKKKAAKKAPEPEPTLRRRIIRPEKVK